MHINAIGNYHDGKPSPTVTPKGGVYRGSDTVSDETRLANASETTTNVDASRVDMAVVLVGGCGGRAFVDVWKN